MRGAVGSTLGGGLGGLGGLVILVLYVILGPGGLLFNIGCLVLDACGWMRLTAAGRRAARRWLPWNIGITSLPLLLMWFESS